jgi:hypothetical protein
VSAKALLRPACWVIGHRNKALMLPEEPFGLYAVSWAGCGRCGQTDMEMPLVEQIDTLMGYVTLWNDVRPIVVAAKKVVAYENRAGMGAAYLGVYAPAGRDLFQAIQRYDELYPEHRRFTA